MLRGATSRSDVGQGVEATEPDRDPACRQDGGIGADCGLEHGHGTFPTATAPSGVPDVALPTASSTSVGPESVSTTSGVFWRSARRKSWFRNRRLCSANTPSGYFAAEMAPKPKSSGGMLPVQVGR